VDRALAEVTNPRPLQFNGDHPFAQLFSEELRSAVEGIVADRSYLVKGSVGQGRWAETPWVAVFDRIVTDSAQRGYYVVYLFRRDGSGVYLSLNQGTTAVLAQARGQYRQVLADRARTYAGLLGAGRLEGLTLGTIDLGGGSTALTPGYEAGNIAARFYPKGQLPEEQTLVSHLRAILGLYADLISALDSVEELDQTTPETQPETAQEARRLRWHLRAEGRNSLAAKRAKQLLGYRCQVCGFDFEARYGELGQRYIEAHHLTPFADLGDRPTTLDPSRDFAVVCSNCHRMIHRQIPPLNVEDLRGRLRTRGS
jgi:5-methylcytosine-specific restriction protein A